MTSPRRSARRRDEIGRIHHHLAGAERRARKATPVLSRPTALVRALLLDELAQYRRAGVYPRNVEREDRTPVFVDGGGVPCAVAHLLRATGEGALVQRIAVEENLATLGQLVRHPALQGWLRAVGLTALEAARIQPAYGYTPADCICDSSGTSTTPAADLRGVLEVRLAEQTGPGPWPSTVIAVYGSVPEVSVGARVLVDSQFGGLPEGALLDVGPATVVPLGGSDAGAADDAAAPTVFEAIPQAASGLPRECASYIYQTMPEGDAALAATARLEGPACAAYLGGIDPAWTTAHSGQEESPAQDAGASDAGAASSDAGVGADAGGGKTATDVLRGDGGGCHFAASDPSVAALLALVGLLVARRRA